MSAIALLRNDEQEIAPSNTSFEIIGLINFF